MLETVKDNIEMASREQIGGGHKIVTQCCCHGLQAQKIYLVSAILPG